AAPCVCSATPPTELYTLSLHDALPISPASPVASGPVASGSDTSPRPGATSAPTCTVSPVAPVSPVASPCSRAGVSPAAMSLRPRSEEHTSELQSRENLVCRLLLEKKNG